VPCCPSNISRIWANLGQYVTTLNGSYLRIHQFISSQFSETLSGDDGSTARLSLTMESDLPWEGRIRLRFAEVESGQLDRAFPFQLEFRQPAWAGDISVAINGQPVITKLAPVEVEDVPASGYDPRRSVFQTISHDWATGDQVEISFSTPVELRRAHPRVKGHQGKAAVTRGPLVYCLESVDNPGIDIFSVKFDPGTLIPTFDPNLLGGIVKIQAKAAGGAPLTFIPYFLWGNRGTSQMTVWVNT
jgi:uncharacterized protein